MAFNGKESTTSGGGERRLYTGLENFKVVAINPNQEELHGMGITRENEPEYLSKTDEGKTQVRVDFWLDNEPEENSGDPQIYTTISFYISDEFVQSSTNKWKVINKFGQNTWLEADHIKAGTTPDNMNWYKTDGVRRAYKGETEMIDFLRNLLNCSKDDEANLSEIKDLVLKGKVTELRGAVKAFPNNKVKVLLGVKESQKDDGTTAYYQTVFNRKTERAYSKDFNYLKDALEQFKANGGAPNTDFGDYPYKLREWSATDNPATATANAEMEEAFEDDDF